MGFGLHQTIARLEQALASFESRFNDYCTGLESSGRRRTLSVDVAHDGRPIVADFSHNDYLGFAQDPALIEAGHAAAQRYGIGSTGSRLLSGNLPPHVALELAIALAKGTEAALIFNSGYQANSSALAALLDAKVLGAEPLVFSDRLNHASLHHACQLMNVRQIRYRHNDMQHLRELLIDHREETRPKFIVAETVFGMDGDMLDMPALVELADEFDAFLYLDEAHATGVVGYRGYGLTSGHMQGKSSSRGVAMGTFSKALGAAGAYIACSTAVRDYLINRCTGFIYSTAPSPAVIGAVLAAWECLPQMDTQRAQLLQRAQDLRSRLHAQGFDTGTSATHIIPLIVGTEEAE
jgi:8-amino-7-oxononanoate synthase